MPESVVLDPTEVAASRTELDINSGPIRIAQAGVDWGDSAIAAYMSEATYGEVPVDYRVPNRQIQIPLLIQASGTVSFDQARAKLQHKVGLFQREGGWVKRILNNGGTVFADIVNATLHLPGGWLQAARSMENEATLSLEAIPDFYGAELTLTDHVETTAAELIFTETAIKGNYPGRVRIVVDNDDATNDQLGLIWSFRSRYYSSASTAATAYEAEALQALDTATKPALSGASGGTVVTHGTVSTGWTPVVGTNIGGTSFLTHVGTYRVYGRVYSTSGTTVQTRFVWDVGDLVNPAANNAWRLPGASNFYICDYGDVRLDQVPVGTHRWQGQVQAKGDVGTENFSVDRLWFVNSDEGMGVLRAPISVTQGLAAYSARSEFNTESGAITGDSLAVGGAWAAITGSDTDDFSAAGGVATRIATSDSGTGFAPPLTGGRGRAVSAGSTTYSAVVVSLDVMGPTAVDASYMGLFALLVDSTTNLTLTVAAGASGTTNLQLYSSGGGGAAISSVPVSMQMGLWYTMQLGLDGTGRYYMWFGPRGSSLQLVGSGYSTVIAGMVAGKIGMYDYASGASGTRSYDNFAAWVPPRDAVAFHAQSVQLGTSGHFREDVGGTAYGPVSYVTDALPRIPPAGLEGRTVEGFVKMSRGDLVQVADSGIDDLSAQIFYRPSYLYLSGD